MKNGYRIGIAKLQTKQIFLLSFSYFCILFTKGNCMSKERLRILFVAHEMKPYLELTQVAEFARSLPPAMQDRGFEIRVLMPRFGVINERRHRLHEVVRLSGINIIIEDNDNPLIVKVASLTPAKMQVYFLDNDEYFSRKDDLRDKDGSFCPDNDERMIFFCKGLIETVIKLGWNPDIVQLNGWLTSLIPYYLKTQYADNPVFQDSKVVTSLYESQFSEKINAGMIHKLGTETDTASDLADFDGSCNSLYKIAVKYSDAVTVHAGDVDSDVLSFTQSSSKPMFTSLEPTENFDELKTFYQSLFA
jgi:starch synthase